MLRAYYGHVKHARGTEPAGPVEQQRINADPDVVDFRLKIRFPPALGSDR
jgi:hypothetical protein